mmetsp:Transcript_23472/g.51006  ORF Transcript_23472/g.51006 Transcript_23472/m.51006 type:complete len:142 (+) Transcript_23472:47-472(+)
MTFLFGVCRQLAEDALVLGWVASTQMAARAVQFRHKWERGKYGLEVLFADDSCDSISNNRILVFTRSVTCQREELHDMELDISSSVLVLQDCRQANKSGEATEGLACQTLTRANEPSEWCSPKQKELPRGSAPLQKCRHLA